MKKEYPDYPSKDKPWMKFYDVSIEQMKVPKISMYQYILSANKDYLNETAIEYLNVKISYRKMFNMIDRTANALSSLGIKPDDIVSISSVTTPEIIYLIYALNKIGAVINFIDPRTSEQNIQQYIEETKSKIVFSINAAIPKFKALLEEESIDRIIDISPFESLIFPINLIMKKKNDKKYTYTITWNSFINYNNSFAQAAEYKRNKMAVIEHTGGTTGTPKGVMLSNEAINSIAHFYCNTSNIFTQRKQVFINIMPPFIAYGLAVGIHMPFVTGMKNIIIPKSEPTDFYKIINRYKPQHFAATPSHMTNLLTNTKHNSDLSFLITPAVGGDAMNTEAEQSVNDYLKQHNGTYIIKGYGMTELASTAVTATNNANKIGSVGIPCFNNTVAIFDEDNNELSYNIVGEICINGPSMMLGYFKNIEETNNVLKSHDDGTKWIHTGDLGYIDEDGFIFIKGRKKRMIIRYDGFKIFPSQIDSIMTKNKNVIESCTVGIKDKNHQQGQVPVTFVEVNNSCDKDLLKELLIEEYKKELSEYSYPIDIVFLSKMPLTSISKIDYLALEQEAAKLYL